MAKLRVEVTGLLLGLLTGCLAGTALAATATAATAPGSPATTVADGAAPRMRALAPELEFGQLDYQRGKVVLREVTIRQDQMRVQADRAEATGLDFDDSSWTFTGKVSVELPEGLLSATQAVVRFRTGRILNATVNGAPATFAQQPKAPNTGARGRAAQIDYDVATGDVQLTGDAWISDESREISSQRIVYSIPQRSFRAETSGDGDGRVRGTIKPRARTATAGANGAGT